jgi:hypothetical protein
MNNELGKRLIIMSNKDFEEYLNKMTQYTEKVLSKKIKPQESLNSLVKSGICNEQKKINEAYV